MDIVTDMKVDTVIHIKANIDDVDGERHGYILESLLTKGALDVNLTPIIMKKNRPGIMLSVITKHDNAKEIINFLMKEGISLGLRVREEDRVICDRAINIVSINGIDVRVKEAFWNGEQVSIKPEHDDCVKLADKLGISIARARELIIKEYQR